MQYMGKRGTPRKKKDTTTVATTPTSDASVKAEGEMASTNIPISSPAIAKR